MLRPEPFMNLLADGWSSSLEKPSIRKRPCAWEMSPFCPCSTRWLHSVDVENDLGPQLSWHLKSSPFRSQHVYFLESQKLPESSSFPGFTWRLSSTLQWLWLSLEPGGRAVFSSHSGTFLFSESSSHTFLVSWGEPRWAWSGCYIPVVNTQPLIIVIEGTHQLSQQPWMGGWMPCNSHSL